MATLEERAQLLIRANNDVNLQAALLEMCRRDIHYWFNNFCYTFNPRVAPYHFPFNLYPFQDQVVAELKLAIDTSDQILLKKSRDLGASWLVLLTFQHYWLFEDGSDFHMTTRKEDDIDKKGSKSTMFEKLRYNFDMLPRWMKPVLGREHNGFMKMVNPLNGNSITGEAPVLDFARSQRYKAILMDEMARLPYSEASYSSASQSSDCIIMPYTPYGKSHYAYKLSKSDDMDHIRIDYRNYPAA